MGVPMGTPKMDGLFHGKSIDKWMITGGTPILWKPQISVDALLERPERSHVDVFVPQLLPLTGAWWPFLIPGNYCATDPMPNRSKSTHDRSLHKPWGISDVLKNWGLYCRLGLSLLTWMWMVSGRRSGRDVCCKKNGGVCSHNNG